MRAIGYFRLGEREGRTSESLGARFEEYCYLNLHQPITVLEAGPQDEGASPIQPLLEHLDRVGADFLVVVDSAADLGDGLESAVRSLVSLDRLEVQVVCMGDEYPDPVQNAIHLFGLGGTTAERSGRARESMSVRALEGRALGRPALRLQDRPQRAAGDLPRRGPGGEDDLPHVHALRARAQAHRPGPEPARAHDPRRGKLERRQRPGHPKEPRLHRDVHQAGHAPAQRPRGHRAAGELQGGPGDRPVGAVPSAGSTARARS